MKRMITRPMTQLANSPQCFTPDSMELFKLTSWYPSKDLVVREVKSLLFGEDYVGSGCMFVLQDMESLIHVFVWDHGMDAFYRETFTNEQYITYLLSDSDQSVGTSDIANIVLSTGEKFNAFGG